LRETAIAASVVATVAVAAGLLSYFGLTGQPDTREPRETRASRAIFAVYEVMIILGPISAGRVVGEARHATFLGVLLAIGLGALAGGLTYALTRRPVARLLAAALSER
jgi:hypothetical protein